MSLSVSAQAMPKMVGLTGCDAALHSTAIGVPGRSLPAFGIGPATFPAISSVIVLATCTLPPSAVTMTGPVVETPPSLAGVFVSWFVQRSQLGTAANDRATN